MTCTKCNVQNVITIKITATDVMTQTRLRQTGMVEDFPKALFLKHFFETKLHIFSLNVLSENTLMFSEPRGGGMGSIFIYILFLTFYFLFLFFERFAINYNKECENKIAQVLSHDFEGYFEYRIPFF